MNRYHVVYERNETGWWTARVPEVPGCHTQGKTVETARRRIREALGLFVDNARKATLIDDVRLPAKAKDAVRRYLARRERAESEARLAVEQARDVVRMLKRAPLKMSGRDAASLLGVSHQRVHQLSQVAGKRWQR